ncbi:MAG: amidase, partial [Candidatus Dormibacteria bacterium]
LEGYTPDTDATIVTRILDAGGTIVGKTHCEYFCFSGGSHTCAAGAVHNPHKMGYSSGGSSSGSAVVVALGEADMAIGGDQGGSIRIPASCCGLFGLKPSRGRVSMAPGDEGWGGFSCLHAVTRTVRDSAVLLDAVCQPVAGDPYWLEPPACGFLKEVGEPPARLRIAFTAEGLAAGPIDPECVEAVRQTAKMCADLGHLVEEARPPGDFAGLAEAVGTIVAANTAATLEAEASRRGRPIKRGEVEDLTLGMRDRGLSIGAAAYIQALQRAHAFGRSLGPFFAEYDVLLLSTLGKPPIPVGSLRGAPPDMRGYAERLFAFMPNTQAFNVTGQPAMSVPLAWSREGLPIGVQFVGQPAGEGMLFKLAAQLEKAQPWRDRRPPDAAA